MIAILCWVLVQTVAPPPSLVGRWDAEARSKGGLGEWLVFSADGGFARHSGAMLDGRWRLTGDVLTIDIENGGADRQSESMTIEVRGDTVRRTSHGVTQSLERIDGRAAEPGLVGTWTYLHPSGKRAYEQFLPDGRYLFRLPMRKEAGRFAVKGTTLTLSVSGARTATLEWRVETNTLLLSAAPDSRDPARRFRGETVVQEMDRKE